MHVPATVKFRGRLYQRVADGDYTQIGNLKVRRPPKPKADAESLTNIDQQYHKIYTVLDLVGDIITKFNAYELEIGGLLSSDSIAENRDAMRVIMSMWETTTNKHNGLLARLTHLKGLLNDLVEQKSRLVPDA